jgi:hypothetical protein
LIAEDRDDRAHLRALQASGDAAEAAGNGMASSSRSGHLVDATGGRIPLEGMIQLTTCEEAG